MPLDRVDQLPLPSLHWYAAFSGLALTYATVYALTAQEGLFGTLFSDVWCTAVSGKGERENGRKRKEGGENLRTGRGERQEKWSRDRRAWTYTYM